MCDRREEEELEEDVEDGALECFFLADGIGIVVRARWGSGTVVRKLWEEVL